MPKKKFKKSIWLPAILALYSIFMSCYFGPRLIQEGRADKFWISVAFEVVVIFGLFFALRRKEKLAEKWPNQIKK